MDDQNKQRLHITVARLKREGKTFEVIIDPQKAYEYLHNETGDLDDVLTAPDVYSDAQSGEHAKDADLEKVFGSIDQDAIAKRILEDGEVQLSAEQRARIRERKHRRVIDSIARRGIDPRTGNPHPPARIEAALEEAKFRIRESASVDKNVEAAIDSIRAILPIKVETREFTIVVPAQHAGRIMGFVPQLGEVKSQEWGAQGTLTLIVKVPAGMRDEIYSRLNDMTSGDIDIHETKER